MGGLSLVDDPLLFPHKLCAVIDRLQANQPGIRVVFSDYEDEDEDEDWGDVIEELGNPWQMEPGKREAGHVGITWPSMQ